MNIFVLDKDPVKAAEYHCNKHVVKMILESAQMLCTAHWLHLEKQINVKNGRKLHKRVRDRFNYIKENSDEKLHPPWKMTHSSHPCTLWTNLNYSNYMWHSQLGLALCNQYELRYGRIHKSKAVHEWLRDHPPLNMSIKPRSEFAIAINDEELKVLDYEREKKIHRDDIKNFAINYINKTGKIINIEGDYLDLSLLKSDFIRFVPFDPVKSYRNYYIKRKSHIAKWEPKSKTPSWYLQ
jgi:hypothetical protein